MRKLLFIKIIMITSGHCKIYTIKIDNAPVRIIAGFEDV